MKKVFNKIEQLSLLAIPLFIVLLCSTNLFTIFDKWFTAKDSEISTIISIFSGTVITLYLTFPNQPTTKLALKKNYKKLMNFLEIQIILSSAFIFLLLIPFNSTILKSLLISLTLAILWNFIIIIALIILARRSDETFKNTDLTSTDQTIENIKEQTNRIERYVERINRKTK